MSNIKNIIFDLGGLFIHLDFNKTRQGFIDLGCTDFDNLYSQVKQNSVFDTYDVGGMSDAAFVDALRNTAQLNSSNAEIIEAWNGMLLDFQLDILDAAKELKNSYNTALLSNTNNIHVIEFEKQLQEKHQIQNLEPFFHQVYYSNRIGMRKPHESTFEWVLKQNNFKASETLFIDDTLPHILGAQACGMQTLHIQTNENFIPKLMQLLN